MTRDEIMNIPAGRDMDKLIAEKIMALTGIRWSTSYPTDWIYSNGEYVVGKNLGWDALPRYSTDISAAWEVVEKLRHRGLFQINVWHNDMCQVNLSNCDAVVSETAPLAICRAALLAVSNG